MMKRSSYSPSTQTIVKLHRFKEENFYYIWMCHVSISSFSMRHVCVISKTCSFTMLPWEKKVPIMFIAPQNFVLWIPRSSQRSHLWLKKKELTKSYKISTQQKGDVANEFCVFNPWHLVKFQPPGPWPWTWLYTPTCPQLPHLSVAVGAGRVKERPYMSLAARWGGELYPILWAWAVTKICSSQKLFILIPPDLSFQFRLLAPHLRFFDPRNPPIRGEMLPIDHRHFLHLTWTA